MKGLFALLALVSTTGFVTLFHASIRPSEVALKKLDRKRKARIHVPVILGAAFLFLICCGLAVLFDLPGALQTTHPAIIQQKSEARQVCSTALAEHDYIAAEAAIRNHTISKQMFASYKEKSKGSLDRFLRKFNNVLLFGVGTSYSIVPSVAAMVVLFGAMKGQISQAVPTWLSRDEVELWDILSVFTSVGLNLSWVAYLSFYLWLEERQVSSCMLLSGHWYTFTCTCFALWMNWVIGFCYVAFDRPSRSSSKLIGAYATFGVVYVALAFRVLINSQMFHHDASESRAGIVAAMSTLPLMVIAAFAGLYFNDMPPELRVVSFLPLEGDDVDPVSRFENEGDKAAGGDTCGKSDWEFVEKQDAPAKNTTRGVAPPPPAPKKSVDSKETVGNSTNLINTASMTSPKDTTTASTASSSSSRPSSFLDEISGGRALLKPSSKRAEEPVRKTEQGGSIGSILKNALPKIRASTAGSNESDSFDQDQNADWE